MAANSLAAMRSLLKKKAFGNEDHIVKLDHESLSEPIPHVSSGSFVIDYQIGGTPNKFGIAPCPGLPRGKILNLYGHPSSGKTTLALTTAAAVCEAGGSVLYLDWENEVAPDYAATIGVPIHDETKFMLSQPNTLEDGLKILVAAAHSKVDLIVIDSVGAGVPEDVFNRALKETGKQGRIGLIAAKWSAFLPKFKSLIVKSNTAVIGIAQMRKNPGAMMGSGDTVQGGEAWKFYSALRIKLARIFQERSSRVNSLTHKVEQTSSGGKIKCKIEKCKVSSSQGSEQIFYIRWGEGIDNLRSLIEISIAHGLIKKGGSWLTWSSETGREIKTQGMEKMRHAFLTDEEAYDELQTRVLLLLQGIGLDSEGAAPPDLVDDDPFSLA